MISSHRLYRAYALKLSNEITHGYFSHGISFEKDSLLLHFVKGTAQIAYDFKFLEGEIIMVQTHWTDLKSKLKSNALVQFKEIENQRVESIEYGLFDRLINIVFSNGYQLVIKGYGKFGNVLMFDGQTDSVTHIFRLNYKKDWGLKQSALQTLWQNASDENLCLPDLFDLAKWKNTFKSIPAEELIEDNPDFFTSTLSEQEKFLESYNNPLNYQIRLENTNKGKSLQWRYCPEGNFLSVEEFFKELTEITKSLFRWFYVEREKEFLEELAVKQTRTLGIRLKTYMKRLEEIKNQRSYKEIGDLILSHAHSIRKGTSEALITDYYTGQRIRLKINPDLNAAENAEKCYRKAKNQHLELEHLILVIESTQNEYGIWEGALKLIKEAQNGKDLKQIRKMIPEGKAKELKSNESGQKPYKSIFINDTEVWIGKNAKSNEQLLKDSHKNDIWMHAADVPGSHVIVRLNGKKIPKNTLELAASVCAFYSKGKSQTLQTVMYTERKFVSKGKNASLGEVKVQKFATIDVVPKNFQTDF